MPEQVPFRNVRPVAPEDSPEPRCACTLLLDVSGSMGEIVSNAGESLGYTIQQDGKKYQAVAGGISRIDLLNEGLRVFHSDLMAHQLASQRVEVSIITFGKSVETVVPFVTANQFSPPNLTADGETPMGAAILQAIRAVTDRKQWYDENALQSYRPWIFLITDGEPTDSWRSAADRIREGEAKGSFAFFVVGVEGANFNTLRSIAPPHRTPAHLKGYSFREMFVWLARSLKSVSQSRPGDQVPLSPTDGWSVV